jgi:hypothetical protein
MEEKSAAFFGNFLARNIFLWPSSKTKKPLRLIAKYRQGRLTEPPGRLKSIALPSFTDY